MNICVIINSEKNDLIEYNVVINVMFKNIYMKKKIVENYSKVNVLIQWYIELWFTQLVR